MTFDKVILSEDELAELKDIQDKYQVSVKVMQESFSRTMMDYWSKIRAKYDLHDCPFHVIGSMVWYAKGASKEEEQAFLKMMQG
jgi:ADP-dependent phosphofructokinase/glucokinase